MRGIPMKRTLFLLWDYSSKMAVFMSCNTYKLIWSRLNASIGLALTSGRISFADTRCWLLYTAMDRFPTAWLNAVGFFLRLSPKTLVDQARHGKALYPGGKSSDSRIKSREKCNTHLSKPGTLVESAQHLQSKRSKRLVFQTGFSQWGSAAMNTRISVE